MAFLKCVRGDEIESLAEENRNAFMLLWQIAYRASRNGNKAKGLEARQALIGDYHKLNMSRQNYRTSITFLEKRGFITTKATNSGTIATLCDSTCWDINSDDDNQQGSQRVTNAQPTGNQRVTTNKKERSKEEINKDIEELFAHWNTIDVYNHRLLSTAISKSCAKALKVYSVSDIKKSMDNYATAYHDPSYYFSYRWGMAAFCKQSNAMPTFLPLGEKWLNYLDKRKRTPRQREESYEEMLIRKGADLSHPSEEEMAELDRIQGVRRD